VQLERFVGGKQVEDVSDPGIWEMMYFGHVHRADRTLSDDVRLNHLAAAIPTDR
jgi:hypothetical protein